MEARVDEEVNENVIVNNGIRINKKRPANIYYNENEEKSVPGQADDLDLVPSKEDGHQNDYNVEIKDYVRSKRAVQDRIANRFSADVDQEETDKIELIQELNYRLVELDQINEDKRSLSTALINQIKFVRDLQASLGTSDNGHITEIIDQEMEDKFRTAKEETVRLKEQIKAMQVEKEDVLHQLKLLQGEKDVTIVTRTGREVNLQKATMGVE